MARMSGRQFDRQMRRRLGKRFGKNADLPAAAVRPAASRVEEITELAEAVAEEHCPTALVQPERIACARGVTMSFGSYGDAFDGMLEHRAGRPAGGGRGEGRFHIFCNLDRVARADSPRARFTLAHELGHYYIDEHRNALAAGRAPAHRSQCDCESPNPVEQEADGFAANLLMPRRRFLDKAASLAPGLDGIMRLAETFGSSLTSTALRYAACDLRPCAVVKWNRHGYAWKRLSSSAFQARYRRTVESPEKLPADSPTARALANEKPPENGFFEAGTAAWAWFPGIQPGDLRDVLFIEQAVALGRFGVLTFLFPDGRDGWPTPASSG